ncbi:hypothetical protein [Enterococcus sp. 5H]|uniref:hypothetical protein n=1 Tax=Enterococcus sp. 5H TaxID=1229490 RepID=UPI002304C277|nr:hypothetical protein [Enterococcus sp. 5H]MDA9469888.1 hypothetical protein [Enterococcus sp. 5H]
MKKKMVVFTLFLLFLLPFFRPINSNADMGEAEKTEDGVLVFPIPQTDTEIYDRYKDNSFQLITKEGSGFSPFRSVVQNVSGSFKELVWSGVMNLGKFNTTMVGFLFSFDLDNVIKEPILKMTASMATGMLSLASTIGILSVMLVMLFKYIGEQNLRGAFRLFLMTIGIFFGLVLLSNSDRNDSISSVIVDIDNTVEAAFVTINPVFTEEPTDSVPTGNEDLPNGELKTAGELIEAKIFRTNVYEPYLMNVYGTSNEETIRRKMVTYKNGEYDRIGILLDNDFDNDHSQDIFKQVTDYEAEELNNKTISWKNNFSLAMQGLFYLILNLAQTIIYFLLCVLRLILILLRWLLFPMMPILLLFGLFNSSVNVFKNGGKAFLTVIGFKAMVSFAMVFVASYMSLGYGMASGVDDPFLKIITIAIYLVTPVGLYFFRSIIGKMMTGNLSLSDVGSVLQNPYRTARRMNRASREQAKANKERRKQAKEEHKKKQADTKDKPKKYNLQTPNSAQQQRSERRNEGGESANAATKDQGGSPGLDRDGETKQNVAQIRRYKADKPKKVPEEKSATAPKLSQLRKERSSGRKEKESKMSHKLKQAHENSRYQDAKEKRDQPERQRLKRQAQERNGQRGQEKMRVLANGRSPRRSGQATTAQTGGVQRHAGNTRPQNGQPYQAKQTAQPTTKWRNTGSNHTAATIRKVQKATPASNSPVVREKKSSHSRAGQKRAPVQRSPKGVTRRRA